MARDLTYYYGKRKTLKGTIQSKENRLKKLKTEYEAIKNACEKLDENHLDVVNKAREIERKAKSKVSGENLAWRGKRKKDFDEMMDDQTVEKAKAFRKEVAQFEKEINGEKGKKNKKIKQLERELNYGYFCLYAELNRVNAKIAKLEREG